MKQSTCFPVFAALLFVPAAIWAQQPHLADSSSHVALADASSERAAEGAGDGAAVMISPASRPPVLAYPPFSRMAISGGVSALGIQVGVTTNLNNHLNLRSTGSFFNYSASNISTNGFTIDGKLKLGSVGASLDVYPFAGHGFRLSPGLLFHNTNGAGGTFIANGGTSFELNGYTYYSSAVDPVKGNGAASLHSETPAFTMTTGWGNVIPHSGRHFSFPVEVGAAFVGAPKLKVVLTSGQVCDANGQNCLNVATDPDVQSNLQEEIAKDEKSLEPLKTYPILSFGVAYSFTVRRRAGGY